MGGDRIHISISGYIVRKGCANFESERTYPSFDLWMCIPSPPPTHTRTHTYTHTERETQRERERERERDLSKSKSKHT